MTGWGQDGPLSQAAGHDVNYIALTGALHSFARRGERPVPPLNTVGDFGGGGMFLAVGVLAALLEAKSSGKGQVVDAAMVDGAAYLITMFYEWLAGGVWKDEPGTNILDTGAHFYEVYETSDGKYVSIGSIEPQFYAELLRLAGLEKADLPAQSDQNAWPAMKERLGALFRTRTRDEWCRIMEGSDVCFAPVLSLREAPAHPHNVARKTFVEVEGALQPAPAPRFSRTPAAIQRPPAVPGEHTDEVLGEWGFSAAEISRLRAARAIA
jgi:alpha-methylacyl-CoA racemase